MWKILLHSEVGWLISSKMPSRSSMEDSKITLCTCAKWRYQCISLILWSTSQKLPFPRLSVSSISEEFGKILDSLKKKSGPYRGMGQFPKPKDLAEVLDIPVADLTHKIKIWGEVKRINYEYLDKKGQDFASAQKWDAHDIVIYILIFGLFLFLNVENRWTWQLLMYFGSSKLRMKTMCPHLWQMFIIPWTYAMIRKEDWCRVALCSFTSGLFLIWSNIWIWSWGSMDMIGPRNW